MAPWRVARSLLTMRSQFNERYPNRKKASDGTIGDAAHASRNSDHNPWIQDAGYGVVSALDITHDPVTGPDVHAIARYMTQPGRRDSRIKYIISAGQICSSTTSPWVWRKYTGSNGHHSHFHVSVRSTKAHYDEERPWDLFGGGGGATPGVRPVLRRGSKGVYVSELQTILSGFYGGIVIDGDFSSATEAAVRRFQQESRITVDGVVGPQTWAALDEMAESVPEPDSPAQRRVLRRGMQGDDVKIVQRLLMVAADGDFGAITEAAVKSFQRGAGLTVDGIVGPQTWAELDTLEEIPVDQNLQRDIICTVFGGDVDPNKSAYQDRWISDTECGVALPYRFKADRPQVDVINRANGRRVVCEIVDVGPWLIDDNYWDRGARPIAETSFLNNTVLPRGPHKGKKSNGAGIDITPQAAREIGLSGKGKVDWAFASERDEGE